MMIKAGIAAACVSALVACGATTRSQVTGEDEVGAVIASVREALGTDRVVDAKLEGSQLVVTLRRASGPGDSAISIWYGKLLAQEVANRLGARVSSAAYRGEDPNGGPDRNLRPSEPAHALASGACRRVADSFAVRVTRVDQLDVLGGACMFVVQTSNAQAFVYDAGSAVAGLRDLPGGPNARPTLIEVVDGDEVLRFVLWWIPGSGVAIGQGGAWVQPGWRSSAIVGQIEPIPGYPIRSSTSSGRRYGATR